jgi:hypothetical protein
MSGTGKSRNFPFRSEPVRETRWISLVSPVIWDVRAAAEPPKT